MSGKQLEEYFYTGSAVSVFNYSSTKSIKKPVSIIDENCGIIGVIEIPLGIGKRHWTIPIIAIDYGFEVRAYIVLEPKSLKRRVMDSIDYMLSF
jgi:hypothetical protein